MVTCVVRIKVSKTAVGMIELEPIGVEDSAVDVIVSLTPMDHLVHQDHLEEYFLDSFPVTQDYLAPPEYQAVMV